MPFTGRFTVFFDNLQEGYGWSESLWGTGTVDYADLRLVALTYVNSRVQILANNVILKECRLSDDEVSGDSQLITVPEPDFVNNLPIYNRVFAAQSPCPIDVSVNLELRSGNLYRGALFLGGCPNSETGAYVKNNEFGAGYGRAFSLFQQFLTTPSNKIGIKCLPKGTDAPTKAITNITFAPGNIVVTAVGHGYNSGDKVRVNGVTVASGRFSFSNLPIAKIDNDNFKIVTYTRTLPGAYVGGGKAAVLVKAIRQVNYALVSAVTHRKRGRVFNQRRGKVRKK